MGKYRTINTDLNRQYRNDLNQNFTDIERDINSANLEIKRVETETIATIDGLVGGGFVEGLETARDNAVAAAANANSKATYANTQGNHAKTQGDDAKAQGEIAKTKGEYADEKAILAGQAAANANLESSNLSGLKVAVVDATQSANLATVDTVAATTDTIAATADAVAVTVEATAVIASANAAADKADTKADLAQARIDDLNDLDADIAVSITNAETATNATIDAIKDAKAAKLAAEKSADNADEKALLAEIASIKADASADNADEQALHTKKQGDYAKTQGDAVQDIFDSGLVASVNGKTGAIVLTASDIGAETELGAEAKANKAETNAKNASIPIIEKGVANGVAKLNEQGKVVDSAGNLVEGKVASVNGKTGAVVLTASDVGIGLLLFDGSSVLPTTTVSELSFGYHYAFFGISTSDTKFVAWRDVMNSVAGTTINQCYISVETLITTDRKIKQTVTAYSVSAGSTNNLILTINRALAFGTVWPNWQIQFPRTFGLGTPEGVVYGIKGASYTNIDSGVEYYKMTGTAGPTNTGWKTKAVT